MCLPTATLSIEQSNRSPWFSNFQLTKTITWLWRWLPKWLSKCQSHLQPSFSGLQSPRWSFSIKEYLLKPYEENFRGYPYHASMVDFWSGRKPEYPRETPGSGWDWHKLSQHTIMVEVGVRWLGSAQMVTFNYEPCPTGLKFREQMRTLLTICPNHSFDNRIRKNVPYSLASSR